MPAPRQVSLGNPTNDKKLEPLTGDGLFPLQNDYSVQLLESVGVNSPNHAIGKMVSSSKRTESMRDLQKNNNNLYV